MGSQPPLVNSAHVPDLSPLAREHAEIQVAARVVEELKVGDLVYAHDGQVYPITDVRPRPYAGPIIGISHEDMSGTLWLTADHLVLTARRVRQLTPVGGWSGIPASHLGFARGMRHRPSPPETLLWQRLRGGQLGISFRRQHQIGPYIADFYCREAGLVIEIDGAGTHTSQAARDYDAQRDAYLSALGLSVLRFPAFDVFQRTDAVLEAIRHAVRQTLLPADSEKQWRYAGALLPGDSVYFGADRRAVAITHIGQQDAKAEMYALNIDGIGSFCCALCIVAHDAAS